MFAKSFVVAGVLSCYHEQKLPVFSTLFDHGNVLYESIRVLNEFMAGLAGERERPKT